MIVSLRSNPAVVKDMLYFLVVLIIADFLFFVRYLFA